MALWFEEGLTASRPSMPIVSGSARTVPRADAQLNCTKDVCPCNHPHGQQLPGGGCRCEVGWGGLHCELEVGSYCNGRASTFANDVGVGKAWCACSERVFSGHQCELLTCPAEDEYETEWHDDDADPAIDGHCSSAGRCVRHKDARRLIVGDGGQHTSWHLAKDACDSYGGQLAVIDSREKFMKASALVEGESLAVQPWIAGQGMCQSDTYCPSLGWDDDDADDDDDPLGWIEPVPCSYETRPFIWCAALPLRQSLWRPARAAHSTRCGRTASSPTTTPAPPLHASATRVAMARTVRSIVGPSPMGRRVLAMGMVKKR